eukprot:3495625-Amphidinium_carterae.3
MKPYNLLVHIVIVMVGIIINNIIIIISISIIIIIIIIKLITSSSSSSSSSSESWTMKHRHPLVRWICLKSCYKGLWPRNTVNPLENTCFLTDWNARGHWVPGPPAPPRRVCQGAGLRHLTLRHYPVRPKD